MSCQTTANCSFTGQGGGVWWWAGGVAGALERRLGGGGRGGGGRCLSVCGFSVTVKQQFNEQGSF